MCHFRLYKDIMEEWAVSKYIIICYLFLENYITELKYQFK